MTLPTSRPLLLLSIFLALPAICSGQESAKLDVCDVSFLWPVPSTPDEAQDLISIEEKLTEDGEAICPQHVFDDLIRHAEELRLADPHSGEQVGIDFLDDRLKNVANWKIAGIRIDPSAPGCSSKIRIDQGFGSIAQIRVIAQPVTIDGDQAMAHDFTMHLVFHYVRNEERPFEADSIRFTEVVNDLVSIKKALKDGGIDTAGANLGVHPGFSSEDVDLSALVRTFLESHLDSARLNAAAFMGVQHNAEPWIFFATERLKGTDDFVLVTRHPSIAPSPGQALSFITSTSVFPEPSNHQFLAQGVSTNQLFLPGNRDRQVFSGSDDSLLSRIRVKHIPDIVANPEMSHFFTTDCISCHTESTLRDSKLEGATSGFAFKVPEGISGVDPSVLPDNVSKAKNWNIRNFGWGFREFGENMAPTVTMRTANEAAESAEFINETYLAETTTARSELAVANPLTLVMTCRDDEAFNQLKAKIEGLLAREDNPIKEAMDAIGNVHFARFVFLEESKQVAVITSYDGDFDAYVLRFVEHIGDVFNLLLNHVKDTDAMKNADGEVHVQSHPDEFLEFVKKYDLGAVQPFYSAYPDLTVQDVKRLKRMANE